MQNEGVAMRGPFTRKLSTIVLTLSLLSVAAISVDPRTAAAVQQQDVVRRPMAEKFRGRNFQFARTELYFGTAKPDGTAVTEEEFKGFLDQEITPRFPDGLTLVKADGQFRGDDGIIVKEQSFVLILFFPAGFAREASQNIEEIRQLYTTQFQQESVLRADDHLTTWVSF